MDPLKALQLLGLELPTPPEPGGNYTSAKTSGNLVYLSGVISQTADGILTGTVGLDHSIEEGYDAATSNSLAPATVPLRPFCGIMGVAPAEHGEFRTRATGIFGGNMDVRELATGATLYLPIQRPGALLSCADAHAAQGDGEVCINGIECPADVSLRFHLHKRQQLVGPLTESSPAHDHTAPAGS